MSFKKQFRSWWRRLRKKDCPSCQAPLKDFGYCDPCNTFPYRKWIDLAEADYLEEEDWRRKDPEGYAEAEHEYRKASCKTMIHHRYSSDSKRKIAAIVYPEVYDAAILELAMLDEFRAEYNRIVLKFL